MSGSAKSTSHRDSSPSEPWLVRIVGWILKTVGWSIVAFLLFIVNLALLAQWVTHSKILKPIINELVATRMNAEVDFSELNVTILPTFPNMGISIDNLNVTSHALRALPADQRSQLPVDADSLIRDSHLYVSIDLLSILTKDIFISDISIDHPKGRIYNKAPEVSNLNIFKATTSHPSSYSVTFGTISVNEAQVKVFDWRLGPDDYLAQATAAVNLGNMPQLEMINAELAMESTRLQVKGTLNIDEPDPLISASIKGTLITEEIPPYLAQMLPGNFAGTVNLDLAARLRPSYFNATDFRHIEASGSIHIERPDVFVPSAEMRLTGGNIRLRFGDGSGNLATLQHPLSAQLHVDSTSLKVGKFGLGLTDVTLDVAASDSLHLPKGTTIAPLTASLKGDSVNVLLTNGGRLIFNNPTLSGSLTGVASVINADISCDDFDFLINDNTAHLSGGKASLSMYPLNDTTQRGAIIVPPIDSLHSVVQVEMSQTVRNLINGWSTTGHLTADSGRVLSPHLKMPIDIRKFDLAFSSNGFDINKIDIAMGTSRLDIEGFLTDADCRQIRGHLKIHGSMIDLDQMEAAVVKPRHPAQPRTKGSQIPHHHTISFSLYRPDTTSVLVPYNIDAMVQCRFDSVQCGSIPLRNFSAIVKLNQGTMTLINGRASTPYGVLSVDATYRAPQSDSISFNIATNVTGVEISQLHSLIPMSEIIRPYFENLRGQVNATLRFNGNISRAMNIVPASLYGHLMVHSPLITLEQFPDMSQLDRWLLFKGDKPDKIEDFTINVNVANNRITLTPTQLAFAHYRFILSGISDFDGNYSCHVGVKKWQLPLKFGIDIAGNIHGKYHIKLVRENSKYHPLSPPSKHHKNIFRSINDYLHRL